MRHLFQTYNALLNAGFAPGEADLLGAAPRYDQPIALANLAAKPELNGRTGRVDGVLDRTNGRLAVKLMPVDGDDGVPKRLAVKVDNLLVTAVQASTAEAQAAAVDVTDGAAAAEVEVDADAEAAAAAAAAYTAVYEYEEGDCVFIDNLAVAHRATPEAHRPHTDVGLRILHRTTIKAMIDFDPPFGLPPQLNVMGPNPLGQGVWGGGGLGYRWDETIPMQN